VCNPALGLLSILTVEIYLGHYRALEWDEKIQAYASNQELGIQVDVEVRNHYCACRLS
jgi:hypothetical protein